MAFPLRFDLRMALITVDFFGPSPLHFSKGMLAGSTASMESRLGKPKASSSGLMLGPTLYSNPGSRPGNFSTAIDSFALAHISLSLDKFEATILSFHGRY